MHMVPLYVILGGPLWRILRKRVSLWFTHGDVPASLKIANLFVHEILTAAEGSCNLQSKKVRVTGHGIDTDHFRPIAGVSKDIDLITVGRITESKNLKTLVNILAKVRKVHDVSLTIVGTAVTETERAHEASLRGHIDSLGLTPHVHFTGRVSQSELPRVLNQAKVFVTAAQNGSLDKAMLEAMACGLPVVSSAKGSSSLPLGAAKLLDWKLSRLSSGKC